MKGQRYALSPNANQAQLLRQWIGCQRFIYNAKVQDDRYFRRFAVNSLQHVGQFAPIDQTYSQYKKEAPFLSEVPSQILRNGAVRWHQAYQRFFKQLGGRPKLKTKQGRQSVFITRELFTLTQTKYGNWVVVLGTKKHPMGAISLNSKPNELHENNLPASICIAIHAGKWSISFATAELDSDGNPVRYPEYTRVLERLRPLSLKEVEQAVNGVDRGVIIPACDAKKRITPELLNANTEKLERKARNKKRYQRQLARQVKGSKRYHRTKHRIARINRYRTQCLENQAHQVSHCLTADDSTIVVALEQLDVQAMTASAKGTKEKHGKNVRQKSGLNRSILSSNWGRLRAFVQYKSFRRGKLFVSVPAPYTSQECSHCRTINRASRRSQSLFACDACGFQDNADVNASQVIAKQAAWGIYQHLHSGQELSTKGSGKKPKPQTPVELLVSRDALKTYHAQGCETGNPILSRLHIC
ncbi:RNA-guided endonuclease InsQ/TnpB family protein [Paenalcaligenes faecalis]|uniref:RNA-guided endonuclease InsQ/TnpB family protein n=1 Tax=Paenalcaligenes faecalis TaxID=2980099 RepID=UPI0022B9BE08|nr:transposase [Paenalcaligenes faecalis]